MPKKDFVPKIVSANELHSGETIYLTASGWSPDIAVAVVGFNAIAAEGLLQRALEEPHLAVGPYLIDVALAADGRPEPVKLRERMRVNGPSVGALNGPPPVPARSRTKAA